MGAGGSSLAHPTKGFRAGSGPHRAPCGPGPGADGPSVRHRCRRQSPTTGDSPAGPRSCGGGPLPCPAHGSRRPWNPGRWSTVRRRGPAPAPPGPGQHLSAHPVQTGARGPNGKLRRKVPRVDGALTVQPITRAVPPRTQGVGIVNAVATRQRRCHQRQQLVAGMRPTRRIPQVDMAVRQWVPAPDDGPGSAANSSPALGPPGGGRRRRLGCGRVAPVVASVGCSLFSGRFCSSKNHYPRGREHFTHP